MFDRFIEAFTGQLLGKLLKNEPLAKHTTLRVGGPAKVFVQPLDKDAFVSTIKLVREFNLPYKVLGKGSNLLASDDVFEGVIIQTDKSINYTIIDDTLVTVGAGVSDVKLARDMAKVGLAGLEFISGIPGTIGGAIFMNAGAYNKEIKDVIKKVLILDNFNELRWLNQEELEFSYRKSIFQKNPDWVIIEAVLELELGDKETILATIKSRKEKRMIAQPLEMPSAGSTFRNPDGHAAWKLVADSGLRGFSVGGAKVSTKHTNFVINSGDATAMDIYQVILHVQDEIYRQHQLKMHREVELFNWSE